MAVTPNLGIVHIEQSQAQKEVTANEAFNDFDEATQGNTIIEVSAIASVIVDLDDYLGSFLLRLQGVPSGPVTFNIPDGKRFFAIANETSQPVTVQTISGGVGATIQAGAARLLVAIGVGVQELTPTATGLPYTMAVFVKGTPVREDLVLQHIFDQNVEFQDNFVGSLGYANTAAPATTLFANIFRIDALTSTRELVATAAFDASVQDAIFWASAETSFFIGDRMEVVIDGAVDLGIADVSLTLQGVRL